MNKLHYLGGIVALALLATACGTKQPEAVVTTTKTKGAPLWIDSTKDIPGIVGVGIEGPNVMGDLMMQRKVAMVAARGVVARQLNVKVQGLFAQLNQQYMTGGTDGKKPITNESMTRMIDDTARELVDVHLAGAAPREFYTDPATKQLYVLVVLDPDSTNRATKAAAASAIRKEIALGEKGLQDALVRLDDALANPGNK